MPKINSGGQPSYDGVSGQVTNATGQQFELDPNKNLDGSVPDGAQPEEDRPDLVSLDGPDQNTPSANTDAAAQAEQDNDEPETADDADEDENGGKPLGDEWDPAKKHDAEPDNQTPGFDAKKSAPAKKAAPAKSTAPKK